MDASLRDRDFLEYRFDARSADSLWLGRQLVEQWLSERSVRDDAVSDLLIAVNELCTDAVRHAATSPERVALRVHVTGADVEVEVEDYGGMAAESPPDLRIAAAVVDEVVLRVDGQRTVVRALARNVVLPRRLAGRNAS